MKVPWLPQWRREIGSSWHVSENWLRCRGNCWSFSEELHLFKQQSPVNAVARMETLSWLQLTAVAEDQQQLQIELVLQGRSRQRRWRMLTW